MHFVPLAITTIDLMWKQLSYLRHTEETEIYVSLVSDTTATSLSTRSFQLSRFVIQSEMHIVLYRWLKIRLIQKRI